MKILHRLSLVLLLWAGSAAAVDSGFPDVNPDGYAAPYIKAIKDAGITTGCGNGNYCPGSNVDRQQMAAFIVRAVEGEPGPCTSAPFGDVPVGHPFCKYIQRLKALNITTGCGGGNFCPAQPVTRDQMAAFLARALEGDPAGGYCGATSPFTDVPLASTFCGHIKRLLELAVTTGCGGGNYCPTQVVNREQMAVFLGRAFLGMTAAPLVLYTDTLSGPTSGGESNAGAYLSIYGKNFGVAAGLGTATKVFIGNCEVANYRHLSPAKVNAKLGIQHIAVQVGALCGATAGTPLPVKVTVGGLPSNTDQTFTPTGGKILFVSLSGNDSTAIAGSIAKPWRYLQTSSRGGAYAALRAGDHIVIRGGHWGDTGFDGAWLRFRDTAQQGSAPSDATASGWIHITAYPGPVGGNAPEDVHYSTPAGVKGGIHGANSAYAGTTGDWISISNLRIDVSAAASSDAAPVNQQYGTGAWRVINNELGPWPSTLPSPNNAKAGGVSGHGNGTQVIGNHIHDIACSGAFENHGIYVDTDGQNWNIAFNWIHDISGGNLIQAHDPVGGVTGILGTLVHHNWLENSGKYGLNIANAARSGKIWNNVVIGAKLAGLRVDTIEQGLDWTIAFNTFYDNDRQFSGSGNAQVLTTWGNYSPSGVIGIYNNIFAAGPNTIATGRFFVNSGSDDSYFDLKHNLWWDYGRAWPTMACDTCNPDTQAIYANPEFTDTAASNLALAASSPAIDAGTHAIGFPVADDFTAMTLRPSGSASDVGAFERSR